VAVVGYGPDLGVAVGVVWSGEQGDDPLSRFECGCVFLLLDPEGSVSATVGVLYGDDSGECG
jgi:hypothetical protein